MCEDCRILIALLEEVAVAIAESHPVLAGYIVEQLKLMREAP